MITRILKGLLIVSAIGGACFYLLRPREEKGTERTEERERGSAPGEELEQNVTAFSIVGRSPRGARQWQLEGDSARLVGDDIYLNNLKAVAHGDEVTVNLTSDSGIYRRSAGEVELIGNVRVVSGTDFSLATGSARWSQDTKEISTEEKVIISREGMVATGTGGAANSEHNWARLDRDVTVEIEPDTTVRSRGPLEVRYDERLAVFLDGVMVEDKDGRLFSDMLTVEFDTENRRMSRVIAEGNVKMKRGRSYTLSEKAIYTDTTKSAELLGRPRIIIDPDEIGELDSMWKI